MHTSSEWKKLKSSTQFVTEGLDLINPLQIEGAVSESKQNY